jgi:ABC-type antimicrobial peptide transport system permease subunit
MSAIQGRLQAAYPESHIPGSAAVVPLNIQLTNGFRLSLWLLFSSVFVLLLVASINTAGILLARGSARKREFALRRVLGGSASGLPFNSSLK